MTLPTGGVAQSDLVVGARLLFMWLSMSNITGGFGVCQFSVFRCFKLDYCKEKLILCNLFRMWNPH